MEGQWFHTGKLGCKRQCYVVLVVPLPSDFLADQHLLQSERFLPYRLPSNALQDEPHCHRATAWAVATTCIHC